MEAATASELRAIRRGLTRAGIERAILTSDTVAVCRPGAAAHADWLQAGQPLHAAVAVVLGATPAGVIVLAQVEPDQATIDGDGPEWRVIGIGRPWVQRRRQAP